MTKTMSIRMDRENLEFLNELTKKQRSDLSKTVRGWLRHRFLKQRRGRQEREEAEKRGERYAPLRSTIETALAVLPADSLSGSSPIGSKCSLSDLDKCR